MSRRWSSPLVARVGVIRSEYSEDLDFKDYAVNARLKLVQGVCIFWVI